MSAGVLIKPRVQSGVLRHLRVECLAMTAAPGTHHQRHSCRRQSGGRNETKLKREGVALTTTPIPLASPSSSKQPSRTPKKKKKKEKKKEKNGGKFQEALLFIMDCQSR